MAKKNNKKKSSKRSFNFHPSLTGMGAGIAVLRYINEGNNPDSKVSTDLQKGYYGNALNRFAVYSEALIRNPMGKKVLISSVGIATLGAIFRKRFPNLKIGGTTYYFKP